MSQYPSPYTPPTPDPRSGTPYGPSPSDPLSPARRASVMMIVLGSLMLLYGMCNGVGSLVTSNDQLMQQMRMFSKEPPPVSIQTMRTATVVFCVIVVGLAIFLLASAGFVRRGGSTAITVALVGVIAIAAILGLFTLIAILAGLAMPVAFAFACALAIPTMLFVLLVVWLIQARKATGQMRMSQAQYQQQYMMYQQAMQQYGQQYGQQQGYGYSYPPPPAPPESPKPGDSGQTPPNA